MVLVEGGDMKKTYPFASYMDKRKLNCFPLYDTSVIVQKVYDAYIVTHQFSVRKILLTNMLFVFDHLISDGQKHKGFEGKKFLRQGVQNAIFI